MYNSRDINIDSYSNILLCSITNESYMIMNLQNFKPMQGTAMNLAKLIYPVYISTKVDGMRINRVGGSCRTKSLKPLGNVYTRELIESYPILEGIEGELTTTWDFGDAEAFN